MLSCVDLLLFRQRKGFHWRLDRPETGRSVDRFRVQDWRETEISTAKFVIVDSNPSYPLLAGKPPCVGSGQVRASGRVPMTFLSPSNPVTDNVLWKKNVKKVGPASWRGVACNQDTGGRRCHGGLQPKEEKEEDQKLRLWNITKT